MTSHCILLFYSQKPTVSLFFDEVSVLSNFPITIKLLDSGNTLICHSLSDIPCGVDFKVIETAFIPEHYMFEQTQG